MLIIGLDQINLSGYYLSALHAATEIIEIIEISCQGRARFVTNQGSQDAFRFGYRNSDFLSLIQEQGESSHI